MPPGRGRVGTFTPTLEGIKYRSGVTLPGSGTSLNQEGHNQEGGESLSQWPARAVLATLDSRTGCGSHEGEASTERSPTDLGWDLFFFLSC